MKLLLGFGRYSHCMWSRTAHQHCGAAFVHTISLVRPGSHQALQLGKSAISGLTLMLLASRRRVVHHEQTSAYATMGNNISMA